MLLAALFAARRLRPASIVAGQFLGIGALVAASVAAALATVAIPEGWTALLGVLPLAIGVRQLLAARREQAQEDEVGTTGRGTRQMLTVAALTIANGGDNLGIYIPLFASALQSVHIYAAVFAALTGLWCWAGALLASERLLGESLRRRADDLLPWVLVALGIYILSGARELIA